MKQFLIIIRGAPASGKTTIAKKLRNYEQKIVWLKVDIFKEFFSEEALLEEQKYVDESALATLKYLLDQGFSVVMEKIFYDPMIIPKALKIAEERGIRSKVFQLTCPLNVLQERDRMRPGIKEGCRKPMGDEMIEKIYKELQNTFLKEAIEIDTQQLTLDECVDLIVKEISLI